MGLRQDRSEATATALLTEDLTANTTIKAVLRLARSIRDEEMLNVETEVGYRPPHSIQCANRTTR